MPIYPLTKFVRESLKPFRKWIFGVLCINILWAVDLSVRPYVLKVLLDRLPSLSSEKVYQALSHPMCIYLGMSFMMTVAFRFYGFFWLKIKAPLREYVGKHLTDRMLEHAHPFYQNCFVGNLCNKVRDVMNGISELLPIVIDHFFSHALAILIAIGTMCTVNSFFALGLSCWIGVFIVGSWALSKKSIQLSKAAAENQSRIMGIFIDIFSNIANVRLFTGRSIERKYISKVLNDSVQTDQKRDWYFIWMFGFQSISFFIYQAFSLWLLILGFKRGTVTAGDFVLVLTINKAIIDCLWSLAQDLGRVSELLGNIHQGLNLIFLPVHIIDTPSAQPLKLNQAQIVFKNVDFNYPGMPYLFQNKSVTVLPGQKVGLVGYSGSGKSTFANLILRIYEITGGYILIDGQNIQEVTQDSLRQAIGMIPQEPSLFNRTLLENIRYGRFEATDAEVFEAARKAHAHTFIEDLPEGYQTYVGERGLKLSGGQRQRIAIARAILKNAPILILDEATSQLDSVTEFDIQSSLQHWMQGKTALVIAHRLSTLLYMDRILVFDKGMIVEDGTHSELLAREGLYYTLWQTQSGGFLPTQSLIK